MFDNNDVINYFVTLFVIATALKTSFPVNFVKFLRTPFVKKHQVAASAFFIVITIIVVTEREIIMTYTRLTQTVISLHLEN